MKQNCTRYVRFILLLKFIRAYHHDNLLDCLLISPLSLLVEVGILLGSVSVLSLFVIATEGSAGRG